ncbi:MAG TPA: Crp/Fnr family transcriptional regulator, partial [Thermoanaerobaculia bacterium]|nr:Crp/Fnr family transcriptional regulator [Thermoanaerobaculia bacterium]
DGPVRRHDDALAAGARTSWAGVAFYALPVSGRALPHFDAVPLFRCLNEEERKLLGPVCRAVAYEKGEEVFREGDPATDLCFVVIGRVKIVKAGPDRDVILGLFGVGEPIGAVALFEGKRFPASAVALEPSTVLRVPEREFFATIDAHPEITRRLLQGLMLRQFEISRRLADLTGPVEKRIARLLLMLATRVGRREGAGATIPLALSRQEIADMTATTIETAIRVMSRWGKENVVITGADAFTIPDLQALAALTAED